MSKDSLQRFIFEKRDIKGAWVSLDKSVVDLYAKQTSYPVTLKRYLNESLAASVLLSTMLKFEGVLSLQARGNGDISVFLAETLKNERNEINIRGIIRLNEDQEASESSADETKEYADASLPDLLGQAYLAVSIQPENAQPYQGLVALEQDSLADNLQDYFIQSEQLDTYFHIASEGDRVVGLMLQRLPQQVTSEEDSDIHWQHCMQLCQTLQDDELLGVDEQTLLYRLFHEETVRLLDQESIHFKCGCSKERMEQALFSVGQDEVLQMFKELPSIDMRCELCGNNYAFGLQAIEKIFNITASQQLN